MEEYILESVKTLNENSIEIQRQMLIDNARFQALLEVLNLTPEQRSTFESLCKQYYAEGLKTLGMQD